MDNVSTIDATDTIGSMSDKKLLALLEYISNDIYWSWNLLYHLPQIDIGDLISWGYIGYTKAQDRYDPSLGFKLTTYAQWWIKAEIKAQLLKHFRIKYRNNCEYCDEINYTGNYTVTQPLSHDNLLDLRKLMSVLTKRERKYMQMYFFEGMSEQEIGTNARYSKQNIDVITDKSIYKMRVRLCKAEHNAVSGENSGCNGKNITNKGSEKRN